MVAVAVANRPKTGRKKEFDLDELLDQGVSVSAEQTDYRTFQLTPLKAKNILDANVFAHQRNLKPKLLANIRRALENGSWHGNTICIAELDFDYYIEDDDGNRVKVSQVLVNGQHTCQATIDTGITSKNTYVVYKCRSQEELSELFNTFDNPSHNRSVEDQCRVFIDTFNDEGWSKSSINKCSTAASVSHLGLNYRSKTGVQERIAILKDSNYYPHARWVREVVFDRGTAKDNRHLAKAASVMSTMLDCHKIDEKAAEAFWEGVRTGEGLKAGPQLELYKLLQKASVGNTVGKQGGETFGDVSLKIRCHEAWNAYRNNKTKFKFRALPEEIPALD